MHSLRGEEAGVGKFILLNEFLTNSFFQDKMRLMKAILDPNSDQALKEIIAEAWMKLFDFASSDDIRNLISDDGNNFKTILSDFSMNPDYILKTILSLNDYQKQALIHTLLIGENGILYNAAHMNEIIDYFFANFFETSEDETDQYFLGEAKKILKIVLKESKPEDVYFLLSHLLRNRILCPAAKYPWDKLENMSEFRSALLEKEGFDPQKAHRKFKNYMYGDPRTNQAKKFKAIAHLFESPPNRPMQKMDALGLLIEIAQSLGSIGVRFLQLMGLYMEVPPKYQEAFKKVYSNVKGQFKLTAYDTVKTHLEPAKRRNMKLGHRLGGGSIITAYRFDTDEISGVIKVVNPNIVAQVNTVFDILERSFKILVEENEDKYGPLLSVLYTVKKWILADVKLAGCQELDAQFAKNHQGVASSNGKYQAGIPKVFLYHDKFVLEEFIEGQTLQHLEALPEDMLEIADFIRQQVFNQVIGSILHSDIHPGNFMVTPAGKVYWLDRTLLLALSEEEQQLLLTSIMQGSPQATIKYFIKGLLQLPVNKEKFDDEKRDEVLDHLHQFQTLDLISHVKAAVIYLRKIKVEIPFNIDMTLKNLLAVEMMRLHALAAKVQ